MSHFDQCFPKVLTDFPNWSIEKEHVCCRVGISEKSLRLFNFKMSQTGTENDDYSKFLL